MKKFTKEQIIQYLYGEASPILKMAIDKALLTDEDLEKELKSLKKVIKTTDVLKGQSVEPSKKTLDSIMDYAKKTKK